MQSLWWTCRALAAAGGSAGGLGDNMKVHKSRLERDREAWTQARASLHEADHCGWFMQKWQHQGRRSGKMFCMVVEQVTCMPVHVSRQSCLHYAVSKQTALACVCNPKPGLLSLPGGSSAYTWSLDVIRAMCVKVLDRHARRLGAGGVAWCRHKQPPSRDRQRSACRQSCSVECRSCRPAGGRLSGSPGG